MLHVGPYADGLLRADGGGVSTAARILPRGGSDVYGARAAQDSSEEESLAMRRYKLAAMTAVLIAAIAAPANAGSFPEHVRPPACEVVTALPVDIVGHLFTRPAAAADILAALLTDACFGGP